MGLKLKKPKKASVNQKAIHYSMVYCINKNIFPHYFVVQRKILATKWQRNLLLVM
jgi:hypothetical protein